MKRIFNYILPFLALAMSVSCSKEITETGGTKGTGTLAMRITATRAEADVYNPLDHLVVSIYNKDGGLLRRYRSQENLPARLELLAGDYRVEVEAGEEKPASFTERFYTGAENFTVTAGAVTPVEVKCNIRNVVAEAKFDKSIGESFGTDFYAWIVAADAFIQEDATQNKVPALKYTTDAKGYFTLPEGVTSLTWHFEGEHPNPKYGSVVKESTLTDIKAPGKYVLTFKFSPDLPGYVEAIPIRVDTSTDDEDDTVVFSPDPILEGVGFDAEVLQRYTSGEKAYTVSAMAQIDVATLEMNDMNYDLLSASPDAGITVEKVSPTDLKVNLSDAFFAGRPAGDNPLKFHIKDTDGGELFAEAPYRFEGILSQTTDSWNRALLIKVVSFADMADVTFSLREKDGTWGSMHISKDTEKDIYTASCAPEWSVSKNSNKLNVHSVKIGSGLRPGTGYEYRFTAGSVTAQGEFSMPSGDILPDGDMENSSLPCFTESGSGSTSFWGSGNNSNTKSLCTQGDANGNRYANMQSTTAVGVMAAGNLFTGTFKLSSLTGKVDFGQKYNYATRPTALRVKYHASVGKVNSNRAGGPLADGAQDMARIFVAIVDWSSRHSVSSTAPLGPIGSGSCSGSWDPETGPNAVSAGKIIGYGSMWINATTEGDALVSSGDELQIYWYDKEAVAPTGNYTLVISCAANAYGDFFNGCTSNHLWVDDFEWVY